LPDDICRLGSFGREHAPVKEKQKKEKDRHKDKSGKDVKSPHGDVVLRSSFSWDSSQGQFTATVERCFRVRRLFCNIAGEVLALLSVWSEMQIICI